jgi:sugar lactone lactonase YvrE
MIMKLDFLFIIIFALCTNFLSCDNNSQPPDESAKLIEVAQSEDLWTGLAVSQEGRIFVNYPRWSPKATISVAEIVGSDSIAPYPDGEWNRWEPGLSPENHFICVQSVYIDEKDGLWILDPANPLFSGVVNEGAKLILFDLTSNQLVQKILFDSEIALQNSYLNDVRIDIERGYAYITDSGTGAIVVVNLKTGESKRVLYEHFSTKAENIVLKIEEREINFKVHSDGLALSPNREYLYYQALTGRNLYRIGTQYIRDWSLTEKELGEKVESVIQSGASDGIAFASDGNLYLTSIEYNAIRRLTVNGKIETVIQNNKIKWPDSFSITPDGLIYFTTSQLHLGSERTEPYKIFKIRF